MADLLEAVRELGCHAHASVGMAPTSVGKKPPSSPRGEFHLQPTPRPTTLAINMPTASVGMAPCSSCGITVMRKPTLSSCLSDGAALCFPSLGCVAPPLSSAIWRPIWHWRKIVFGGESRRILFYRNDLHPPIRQPSSLAFATAITVCTIKACQLLLLAWRSGRAVRKPQISAVRSITGRVDQCVDGLKTENRV